MKKLKLLRSLLLILVLPFYSHSQGNGLSFVPPTQVSATSPIVVTSNTAISIPQSTSLVNGFLSSTDWNTFNNAATGIFTSVAINTGSVNPGLAIAADESGNVNPAVITSSNGANSDILLKGINNSRIIYQNITTGNRWFVGNNTVAGGSLEDFYISNSANTAVAPLTINFNTGDVKMNANVSIGAAATNTPTAKLQIAAGTAAIPAFKLTTQPTVTVATLGMGWLLNSNLNFNGGFLSRNSFTAGIGYAAGTGSTVTQATSRTTGVTINSSTGAITLVSAAGSALYQTFTVTNSAVAATDVIVVNQKSGTDLNVILVTNVAASSFKISFATTGGVTTEQPVFNFAVIKGSTN